MKSNLVMTGNGIAGVRCIEEIIKRDLEAFEIIIIGDEPHPNYNRIILSNVLFTGLLLKRIKQIISASTHGIVLCQNLEFDDLMKQTCIEGIEEKYNESYLSNVNEVNW